VKGDAMLVSTSILGIKDHKKRHIRELNKTKTDYIHLDIMDGLLVANKNDEFSHLKHLVKASKYPIDIHLMVKDVIKYVDMYKQLKPLYLTFHIEATDNPLTMIDYIKNNHIKVGISINPHTPLEKLQDYLECIDLILLADSSTNG
jgi:ribulose-phosphate 3-epimerase